MASSLGARQAAPIRSALSGAATIALGAALAASAACHKPKHDRLRWAIGVAKFDATALGLASARSPDPFVDAIRPGLLISAYPEHFEHQDLYLATSPDLVHRTQRPQPLLDHQDPALGVESLYRSTGIVEHGTPVVWYAMQTP